MIHRWRRHGYDGVIGISASEIGSFIVAGERVPDVSCAVLGVHYGLAYSSRLCLADVDLCLKYM